MGFVVFLMIGSFILGRISASQSAKMNAIEHRFNKLESDVDTWRSKYYKSQLDFGEYRAQNDK